MRLCWLSNRECVLTHVHSHARGRMRMRRPMVPASVKVSRAAYRLRGGGVVSTGHGLRMAAVSSDCECTIVGAGRIGQALRDMGRDAGFSDSMVGREDSGLSQMYVCDCGCVYAYIVENMQTGDIDKQPGIRYCCRRYRPDLCGHPK